MDRHLVTHSNVRVGGLYRLRRRHGLQLPYGTESGDLVVVASHPERALNNQGEFFVGTLLTKSGTTAHWFEPGDLELVEEG